ncbi:MAG: HAD family hydrolase [Lachnospiraceae bacterium]|nr:HAD family hydrolase [Lachnospiraceae bacterium]
MSIRLVATDMDGTLLNSQKVKPAGFVPWVLAHPQIKTVIASGRQYYTLERDFEEIRDHLTFIAENGALVFDRGQAIYKNVMKKEDVLNCIKLCRSLPNAATLLCGVKSAYLEKKYKEDAEVQNNAILYYDHLDYPENLEDVIDSDEIVKMAIYFKGATAEEYYSAFDVVRSFVKPVLSGDSWIDIQNQDVNKGVAVAAIQEKFQIPPEDCMAFGDYLNDLELLKHVGESYCMVNGHDDVKAVAKHITEYTNDEEGVMRVLETIE